MKNKDTKTTKVGVIIGRFQIHDLHQGHKYLISEVMKRNDEICFLLGAADINPTKRNPMSFQHRKEMINHLYPKAKVFEILDSKDKWSENIDILLKNKFKNKRITLYGSRDSFIKEYFGELPVIYIKEKHKISATEIRNKNLKPKDYISFRIGLIEAHKYRFPISYQVVDIIVWDKKKEKIIIGQKEDDNNWRLLGGFVDTKDKSLEYAAERELSEEVKGIKITKDFKYLGSIRIESHRYRNEEDKLMSSLFVVEYKSGLAQAGDDLQKIKWIDIKDLQEDKNIIIEEHKVFIEIFLKYIGGR